MATRFFRAGTTPTTSGAIPVALAPAPAGLDDPTGLTTWTTNGDSDPIFVGDCKKASVFLSCDGTQDADLLVSVAPTSGGPWLAIGSASVDPSLAAPIMVDVFSSGRCEYVKITVSNYVSDNPRAFLVSQK